MDFLVEHTIHAAPEDVAKIMLDPDREGEWMSKGGKAERLTPGPLEVGSRVRHDAGILGWKVSFVTSVKALDPGHSLTMEVVDAKDHGVIVYRVAPTAGGTIASIHVTDEAMARIPHSVWARKQQAQANLEQLALAVHRAQA